MTQQKQTQDETESTGLKPTRRQVVGALVASGVIGAVAAGSSASTTESVGIGGGPMSDEASHRAAQVYRGPESDLPDAGVKGRYWFVTEAGSEWSEGDTLEDNGEEWTKLDLGVGLLNAEELSSASVTVEPGATGEEIREALERVGPGGTIILEGNEYVIDDPPVVGQDTQFEGEDIKFGIPLKDGQTLRGAGDETVVKLADGYDDTTVFVSPIGNEDPENGNTGLRVENITVDGNRHEILGSGQWEGINFKHVSFFWIDSCKFLRAFEDGVDFDDCSFGWVSDSYAEDNGKTGFHPSFDAHHIRFKNCVSENNGFDQEGWGFQNPSDAERVFYIDCMSKEDRRSYRPSGVHTKMVDCDLVNPSEGPAVEYHGGDNAKIDGGDWRADQNMTLLDADGLSTRFHVDGLKLRMPDGGERAVKNLPDKTDFDGVYYESPGARFIENSKGDLTITGGVVDSGNFAAIDLMGGTAKIRGVDFRTDDGHDLVRNAGDGTVINGRAPNDGNPSAGEGYWGTRSDRAHKEGIRVYDETNHAWYDPLHPDATDDWA